MELTKNEQKKLQSLIDECGEVKAKKKGFADAEKELVATIKTTMGEHNLDDVEADAFIAQYRLTKQESLDEDALLAFLIAELGDTVRQLGVVETKEYINTDALEKAVYKGDISEEIVKQFSKFKIVKRIPKLTIKTKGGKYLCTSIHF